MLRDEPASAEKARFHAHLAEQRVGLARLACVLVAALIVGGAALDWAVHPEMLSTFLNIRLLTAAGALLPLLLSYYPPAKRFSALLFVAPILIGAIGLQLMIHQLGGYRSSYYAGLNLCLLAFAIAATLSNLHTVLACCSIVGMWIVSALLDGSTFEFGPFFHNLFFLNSTAIIAIGSNALRYREAEREFQANEKLKQLDTMKSQFFSNISHELRTPLTLALGPVEGLISEISEPSQRERLQMVRQNQLRLLHAIEELLALSRLEAGSVQPKFSRTNLCALVGAIADAARGAMEHKGIRLVTEFPDKALLVYVDGTLMDRVVINLVNNALKFTPEGGQVTVRVASERGQAVVSVRDTGIGLSKEQQGEVFGRFYQVDGSATRTYQGTGIGLSLVKEYTELHGGEVSVAGALGEGATFTVRLPLGKEHLDPQLLVDAQPREWRQRRATYSLDFGSIEDLADEGAADSLPEIDGAGVVSAPGADPSSQLGLSPVSTDELLDKARVLVVDDTADMRRYLRSLLAADYEVFTARDGQDGLEKARALEPDLVLSDVMMPRMSGDQLCQAIKNADGPLSRTPVVLLTARAEEQARLEGLSYGADDYLLKPFVNEEVKLRVRNLVIRRRQEKALQQVHNRLQGHMREIEGDLQLASDFQRSLLPQIDLPAPLAAHAVFHPADNVGGDLYHARPLASGGHRLLLADMTDHGVKAGVRAIAAWAEYTALDHDGRGPADVLRQLNDVATAKYKDFSGCCLCLDLQLRDEALEIRYAQAGDAPMTRVSAAGWEDVPPAKGFILGLFPNMRFEQSSLLLGPGERLYLYTDGMLNQRNEQKQTFREQLRTKGWAATAGCSSVRAGVEQLMDDFQQFRGQCPQHDDVTVVGIEVGEL